MPVSESTLQEQVADYLQLQYPDVLFHSDFGSGVKLTPGQAKKQKRQNGGRRGWPDMVIAQPILWASGDKVPAFMKESDRWDFYYIGTRPSNIVEYESYGLFLELKKDGETLYPGPRAKNRFKSKDGKEYKTEHLMEQADCLYDLRQRGYCAEFAIGFDEAKKIIDEYLGGDK